MDDNQIISIAANSIQQQSAAIGGLSKFINNDFARSVNLIHNCKGRLVVSGMGKSAIIAQKIVATLNSTGTASIFMHAADAIHGDIGMVQQDDVVLVISKSGDSPEIKVLIPLLKNFGNTIIAMSGNEGSFLAKNSDLLLNTTVEQEACPHNLAPTTSTTAQMVMGDALAICLMELKGFTTDQFAKFHPGGTLGKKLYLRVADLYIHNERPAVYETDSLKDVILEITKKRLGVTAVLDAEGKITGIITDGDLRRMLEKEVPVKTVTAKDIMGFEPKKIAPEKLAIDALGLMRSNDISQLVVADEKKYYGIIHLHDLIREGII
ncbi:KpsF/GutQ family sugar-phosphate isomerase [soil metagenome]